MACKNKSVRLFCIFFCVSLIELSTFWKLVFKLSVTKHFFIYVHYVPKGKPSRYFSQLLLPLLRRIKE